MKRKIALLTLVLIIVLSVAFTLVACGEKGNPDNGDNSHVGSTETDDSAKVTAIQGGTVDGLTILLDVGPTVQDVELSGMLTVSWNSSWQLYLDKLGQVLVPTKYATDLVPGDNTYYVVVNSADGSVNRTYTLCIHKQYYTTVSVSVADEIVKTYTDVLTHTTIELPTETEGYDLVWDNETYFVTGEDAVIIPNRANPKTFTITLDAGMGTLSGEVAKDVLFNSNYTLPVPTRRGYSFAGWLANGTVVTDAEGESKEKYAFTSDKTYTADWKANLYNLTVISNDTTLGTVNEVSGEKEYDSTVRLEATPKTNCYFDGWYKGDVNGEKVSDSRIFNVTVDDTNPTYVAKFVCYTLTTSTNDAEAGTFTEYDNVKVAVGAEVTVTATVNVGYLWLGWFDGTEKVSQGDDLTYTFEMDKESRNLTAKFEKCTSHTAENCVCTKCGKDVHSGENNGGVCSDCGKVSTREGDYVWFGTYPQSEVTDETLKNTLTASAGVLPTASNVGGWTSYGYIYDGNKSVDMWFIDVENAGEKYRGVYFTSYRPSAVTSTSVEIGWTSQDDNGYFVNNVYWFKYKLIKWRILSEKDGEALILAELILDAQPYCAGFDDFTVSGTTIHQNNWEHSVIREWLNDEFYNTAFGSLQKSLIKATYLDNKNTAHGENESNKYATCQNNTTDNVFLLSHDDLTNEAYGFVSDESRAKKGSDYANAQGLENYEGVGNYWLLRSAHPLTSYTICLVYEDGYLLPVVSAGIRFPRASGVSNDAGVVPAMTITLE